MKRNFKTSMRRILSGLTLTLAAGLAPLSADTKADDIDAVTYGIFNYKWSYLNEQDRTFSIKNPYWFTRIYNLGTANNFESGVALKIGDGFEGKGGYLTFTGGFLDGNLVS